MAMLRVESTGIDWNLVGKGAIWSSINVRGLPGVASQELGYAAQRLAPDVFALVALHRQRPISKKKLPRHGCPYDES